MKRQTILLWVLIWMAVFLIFVRPSVEFFRSKPPAYCAGDNSCLSQGCSLDPSNQPCDPSRTTQKTITASDTDWGSLLGGQTIQVCADTNGNMMDSNTCNNCSTCGVIVPPSGNLGSGLCVPLTPKGCMKNAPTSQLLSYLNSTPEAISCCGE